MAIKKYLSFLTLSVFGLFVFYLLLWPVKFSATSWAPPESTGYQDKFSRNSLLAELKKMPLEQFNGPEDITADGDGNIFVSTESGDILKLDARGRNPAVVVNTGGRPLGIQVHPSGRLIIADAKIGLLAYDSEQGLVALSVAYQGEQYGFTNNVEISRDGLIYFTDASSKYAARNYHNIYDASTDDILEHGGHGRVFSFDQTTRKLTLLASGFNFANGVALSDDENYLYIAETGHYRIMRLALNGPNRGEVEEHIGNLPGFPDNLTRGQNGKVWVGLIAPRNTLLDALASRPFLRKMIYRMPKFLQPKAEQYSHVFAFNDQGNIVENLQDSGDHYASITSVLETDAFLFIGSLHEDTLGRLDRDSYQ